MAKNYLAIPASSAPCERIFKSATLAFTKKRSKLTDQNGASLVFLRENYRLTDQVARQAISG